MVMKKWQKETEWLIRDKYAGNRSVDLADDLRRLRLGEPVDYVIGWKEFLGVKVDLSWRPLIPRLETEYWVNECLENIPKGSPFGDTKGHPLGHKSRSFVRVHDIFAGSGCVGLAILKYRERARVDFADLDKKAIKQIKTNLDLNKKDIPNLRSRSRVIPSNVFSGVKGQYDLILANPPYIPSGRKLNKSVVGFEPKSALFAGAEGLSVIKKFLKELPKHLKKGGVCYLEFDSGQKSAIDQMLKKMGYQNYTFHRDQFGRWRFIILYQKYSITKPRLFAS